MVGRYDRQPGNRSTLIIIAARIRSEEATRQDASEGTQKWN